MTISFAGQTMLLNDTSGLAEKFCRAYSQWPQSVIRNPPPSAASNTPIPRPNWPEMPSLGVNALYYPVGASRWACGLFLTDGDGVEALTDVVGGELKMDLEHDPAPFYITTSPTTTWDAGRPFSVYMHKLDPIPLSTPEHGNTDTLWVIPIVCERYFWQGLTAHLKSSDTWAHLITELATALSGQLFSGVSETVFIKREMDFPGTLIDPAISIPDPCFFGNQPVNVANAMDAACWSLGLRFVPENLTNPNPPPDTPPDSTYYRLMRPDNRSTIYPGAVKLYETQRDALAVSDGAVIELGVLYGGVGVAGGDNASTVLGASAADIPNNVQMLFMGIPATTTSINYTSTKTTGLTTSGTFDHRVWCPAVPTAANHADLDTLNELWAVSFGVWLKMRMRWTWAGGPTLRFTGFEDYQLFEHSLRGGVPRGMTRIESLPRTWGWEFVPLQLPGVTRNCGGGGGGGAIGRALSAITPATSNLLGSAFKFVQFVVDTSVDPQTTPQTLKEELSDDPRPVVVQTDGVNRSTKLSGGVDSFIQCHDVNGEWVLMFLDDTCPT